MKAERYIVAFLALTCLLVPSNGFPAEAGFPSTACFSVSGENADLITHLVLSSTPSPSVKLEAGQRFRPNAVALAIFSSSMGTIYASGIVTREGESFVGNLFGSMGTGPQLNLAMVVLILNGRPPHLEGQFFLRVGEQDFGGNLTQVPCKSVSPPSWE